MLDVKRFVAELQDYIARALSPLVQRQGALEERLAALPVPQNGRDGADGKSVAIDDVMPLVHERVDAYLKTIPAPPIGRDGVDGKSVTTEEVLPTLRAHVDEFLAQLPVPAAGKDGADGESVSLDDVMPLVREQVETFLRSIDVPKNGKDGRDGADGRDGNDGVSPSVDDVAKAMEDRVLARFSEWALGFERQASERVERFLSAIPKPKDGRDALDLEDFDIALSDDGRTLTVSLRRGDAVVEKSIRLATLVDRGVFRDTSEYLIGDGVTWAGSYFIAQKDAPVGRPGEPGCDGWRLAVKKGRDGSNGRDGIDKTATVSL